AVREGGLPPAQAPGRGSGAAAPGGDRGEAEQADRGAGRLPGRAGRRPVQGRPLTLLIRGRAGELMAGVPLSFEFYPPKTDEQRAQLDRTAARLRARDPEYVSCTFGAGGSTLSYTPDTVQRLRERHALDAAPHLSCMGGS